MKPSDNTKNITLPDELNYTDRNYTHRIYSMIYPNFYEPIYNISKHDQNNLKYLTFSYLWGPHINGI